MAETSFGPHGPYGRQPQCNREIDAGKNRQDPYGPHGPTRFGELSTRSPLRDRATTTYRRFLPYRLPGAWHVAPGNPAYNHELMTHAGAHGLPNAC
jgi:hypothetical protein